ncbi:MAG: RpiB/LacA/LacB family sugar-phosphate isomerase [Rikenellaceae bacterium]
MNNETKLIGLASDHGGYSMKEFVAGYLLSLGYAIKDLGCYNQESVNYPDFGHALASGIESGEFSLGFAFCGSANGISMSINRHKGVRAAICWKEEIAKLAREHNDANVCSIPGRFIDEVECAKVVDAFLETQYEGGRHQLRVEKIEIL